MSEHTKESQGRRLRDDEMLEAVTNLKNEIGHLSKATESLKASLVVIDRRLSNHSTKINWIIGVGSGVTATFGFMKAWLGLAQK